MPAIAYHKRILGVLRRQLLFGAPSGLSRERWRLRPGVPGTSCAYISFYTFPPFFGGEPLISAHSHSREVVAALSALGKREMA